MSYGVFDKKDGLLCAVCLNILGTDAAAFDLAGPYPLCMKQFISVSLLEVIFIYAATNISYLIFRNIISAS